MSTSSKVLSLFFCSLIVVCSANASGKKSREDIDRDFDRAQRNAKAMDFVGNVGNGGQNAFQSHVSALKEIEKEERRVEDNRARNQSKKK